MVEASSFNFVFDLKFVLLEGEGDSAVMLSIIKLSNGPIDIDLKVKDNIGVKIPAISKRNGTGGTNS